MCGIAGYVGISESWGESVLRRMASAQAHRGPDGEGIVTAGLVGLAHRRLAVIDRPGSAQPMRSADGRYLLVYNGEVYNYRQLRRELSDLGHAFATAGDTEVVLASFVEWGAAAFDRFEGMFALAIADTLTGRVTLARDPFGIKPLYLAADDDGRVFFASEIRPLLATGAITPRPDDTTIYRYLRFRVHDDTPRTFFAGIERLMPGERADIAVDGGVTRSTYTSLYRDLSRLAESPVPYDEAARERFRAALRDAVRSRLVSDVPVGTALSGGLDSSTIVATINALLAGSDREASAVGARQQTFSAVFPGESNDEERYVDAVAAACGPALRVHKVRPDADRFLVDLRDFVRTQEEPVISTGPYAQYCVMREASRHVTVMLDGQGADEMLAGYLPYHLVAIRDLARREGRVRAAAELGRSLDVLWRLGRFRAYDALRRRRHLPVESLLAPAFREAHAGQRLAVIRDDLKARLVEDLFRHSLPALLRYEDRNTMRFSVEGRVPFLDTALLRLLWSLEPAAIVHKGWNKRALRDATAELLPPLVHRRRNKIGFTTPEDTWLRRIKNDVYLILSSARFGARPYFDQPAVLRAFQWYLSGRAGADTMAFWRMINVELWLREFIDAPLPTELSTVEEDAVPLGVDGPPGVHPQAPAKPDHQPNPGKTLVLAGGGYARFPLRVDLVRPGDDLPALAAERTAAFFGGLRELPAPARAVAQAGRWYLFVSEKVVAVAQGRVRLTTDVHCGPWARVLSRFVTRTPYGIGLGHPATMQLAIGEVGLPRILLAAAAGAAGKAVGRRGWFYRVAGSAARAIDGPTEYSAYPANVSAKLAPADPSGAARAISAAVRAALASAGDPGDAAGDVAGDAAARAAESFGGTVVIDANDLGQDVLGQDTDRTDGQLVVAFRDNPLGQAREQTPFAVVVAQWPDPARPPRLPRQRRAGRGSARHWTRVQSHGPQECAVASRR